MIGHVLTGVLVVALALGAVRLVYSLGYRHGGSDVMGVSYCPPNIVKLLKDRPR